uniref:PAS domain-containing protein n=1 Tax=Pseudorhodoferax sp. TaxID=1993553 RepID=UPI002DD6A44E
MAVVLPPQHAEADEAGGAPDEGSTALIVCDRAGHIQRTNAAWLRLFGRPAGRVPALFDAALHAEGDLGVQALLRALQEQGGVVDALALRLLRHDGVPFPARLRCASVELGGHTWYSAWVSGEPPPDALDQALLLDGLPAGACAMAGGRLLRANATFARMFGFADAHSLVGLEIAQLYEDDAEFQRFDMESRRSFEQDGACSSSWRARRQDGSIFQVQGRGRSVVVPGVPGATIWMLEDEAEIRGAEEIRKENESYSRMFQQSHIAISIYDPATDCYVDCNEAARKLYGFERAEDVVGRTVLSISAPMQSSGRAEEVLAAGRRNLLQAGQESPSFEWRHRRPDGTDWMAECRGTTFRYRGRTLIQFTLIDITKAKEVQRQVKEMAVFLQTMIDRMPNAVFYKGPDTRFLGCNEAFEQALGVTRAELVGKRLDELEHMPEPLRSELQAEHEQVIADAAHVQRETRFRFADGRVHQVLYAVSGFRKRDGSPGGLVGVMVDLEALKAAENALGVAQKEQAAMFETAGVGIAFLRDGVIARCNRELGSMFGYAVGELEGQRMGIWYGGDADHGEAQERLAQ